jgi:predicted DNA-binding transcriptional regulator YafY
MKAMARPKSSYGRVLSALVYKILLEEADEGHPLLVASADQNRNTISKSLADQYKVEVNPRTISLTLFDLEKIGIVVQKDHSKRGGWYPVRDIDEDFARVILLSLYGSNTLPNNEIKEIAASLAPVIGKTAPEEYDRMFSSEIAPWEKRIPGNMAVINEAIKRDRRISYTYALNADDGNVYPPEVGYIPDKTVNPLSIIAQHGDFYLLYSLGGKDQIRSLRIDNIYSVKISREQRIVPEGFSVKEYMKDRPYAFTGEIQEFKVLLEKDEHGHENGKIRFIRQYFGNHTKYERSTDGKLYATIKTDWNSFKWWYVQYADAFIVVSPEAMRGEMRKYAKIMLKKNKTKEDDI